MTQKQAIDLVLRSASAHANGHGQCLDILRAVEMVRELLNVVKRKPMAFMEDASVVVKK